MGDETVVSSEDLLRIRVLTLGMENVQLQLQGMLQQIQAAKLREKELVTQMGVLKAEFLQKYGVDLSTVQIGEDGKIVKP